MIPMNEIPEAPGPTVHDFILKFMTSGFPVAEVETADIKVLPRSIITGINYAAKKYNLPVKGMQRTINKHVHHYIVRTDLEAK